MLKRWILILSLIPSLGQAADFSDPEWPCVQRKVPHLSVGQMWAGPVISDQDLKDWRKDADASALAPAIALRRTSEDDAAAMISTFADGLSDEKSRKLSLLFAGAFALIERERYQIISGIGRYARTQTALTQAIETSQNTLTGLMAIEDPDFDIQDQIEELQDKIQWDTRIFKDRQQSLSYVCETPVILERRAFGLARAIMEKLD